MKQLCRWFLLCGIIFISFAANVNGQADKEGLTKIDNPVLFGKLSYLTGYGFDKENPDLRVIRIPDKDPGFPAENTLTDIFGLENKKVKVHQKYENVLTIELPEMKHGIGVLFIKGHEKREDCLMLNKPQLQWLSTDLATMGDTVRAIGKGLVDVSLYPERDANGKPVSYGGFIEAPTKVAIRDANGKFYWAQIVQNSSYDVHFKIPDNIAKGKAEVYIHAGFGGQYGWSSPQILEIGDKEEWPVQQFNVMDYGAVGNGIDDDSQAIEKAVNAARSNGGGIIYFPAGGYHLNKTLRIPPKTVLRGESRERCWIYLPDGFHTNALDTSVRIPFAGEGSIGFENLSIHAVYVDFIVVAPVIGKLPKKWSDFSWENEHPEASADNSFIRNCRLMHNPTHLYHRRKDDATKDYFKRKGVVNVLLKGNNIEILNSEFFAKECCVYLCDAKYSIIAGNLMHSGNAGNAIGLQHSTTGYEKIIVEDNQLEAFSPTHHGSVWMMHGGKNIIMARNNVVQQYWVSDNEGLLGHMWGYRLPLFIKNIDKTSMQVDEKKWEKYWDRMKNEIGNLQQYFPFNKQNTTINDFSIYEGHEVQIFRGKGLGQVNTIASVKNNQITFKYPFKTQPDKTSMLVVHEAPAFRNLIFVDNVIEDTGQPIFIWGHGHEIVIDGNSTSRTGPIGPWTVFHAFNVAGGCHFYQIINNYCNEGRLRNPGQHRPGGRYAAGGIGAHYSCESRWSSGGGALSYVGYVIRNNYLVNDCSFSYLGYDYTWCDAKIKASNEREQNPFDMIGFTFEDNTVKNSKYGMLFGSSVKAVLKDNHFYNVETNMFITKNNGIKTPHNQFGNEK